MSEPEETPETQERYVALRLVRTGETVVRVNADHWEKAKAAGAVDLFLCAEIAAVTTRVTIVEPDGTRLDSSGRRAQGRP